MRIFAIFLVALLLATTAVSPHAQATPAPTPAAWPDTAAGQMASVWVKAVNGDDVRAYQEFVSTHFSTKRLRGRTPEEIAKQHTEIHRQVIPLELASVTSSEPTKINVTLKTRTGELLDLALATDPGDSSKIDVLDVARRGAGGVPSGGPASLPDAPLSNASVQQMCATAAYAIESAYVDRATAPKFAASLRTACDQHKFDNLTKRTFLREFTDKLREITGDRHMYVRFDPATEKTAPLDKSAVDETMKRLRNEYGHGAIPYTPQPIKSEDAKWPGHGLQEVKMLEDNIGYISIAMFPDISEAAGAGAAAMRELAGAKALILDLRDMRGGSQEMVNLFCSYLFSDPHKLLVTTTFPAVQATAEQYTFAKLNSPRLANVPVYILTNARTFSAGEALAYILQQFKRATIVGEKTAGGGHLNEFFPLGEGFFLSVSFGKPVHPVTKKGWEGVGVIPDVPTPAAEALDRARALAQEKLRSTSSK